MAIEGIRGEAREACNRFAKVMTNLCPRRSADAAGREFAAACPLAEVVLVERERRATLMPDAPPVTSRWLVEFLDTVRVSFCDYAAASSGIATSSASTCRSFMECSLK